MFFDSVDTEDSYRAHLRDIALLQRELLELRFDFKTRMPRLLKTRKKGLFGRETFFEETYLEKAEQLAQKKQELEEDRERMGYPRGMYWWNLSWEQLAPALLWNLTLPEEEEEPDESGWRRAYSLACQPGREDNRLLCLQVRGHRQESVSARRRTYEKEHSAYSREERERLEDAYNDRRNTRAMLHVAFADRTQIHSVSTGWDYGSASEYYTSAEYLSDRMRDAENYSQSLYTVEEVRSLSVRTSSSDYSGMNGVAEFHVDENGRLDYAEMLDFAWLRASGDVPEQMGTLIEQKDAAVLCAGYLAQLEEVRTVPMELLCRGVDQCAVSYEDALLQAQVITCLAEKLERN